MMRLRRRSRRRLSRHAAAHLPVRVPNAVPLSAADNHLPALPAPQHMHIAAAHNCTTGTPPPPLYEYVYSTSDSTLPSYSLQSFWEGRPANREGGLNPILSNLKRETKAHIAVYRFGQAHTCATLGIPVSLRNPCVTLRTAAAENNVTIGTGRGIPWAGYPD